MLISSDGPKESTLTVSNSAQGHVVTETTGQGAAFRALDTPTHAVGYARWSDKAHTRGWARRYSLNLFVSIGDPAGKFNFYVDYLYQHGLSLYSQRKLRWL